MKQITKKYISELFNVDLKNGKFFWKVRPANHKDLIGKEAGSKQKTVNGKEYWLVSIDGKKYKRSRLMFMFVHDRFPSQCIDHINGNSLDDVPQNLREASILENSWNHKGRKKKSALPMGVRKLLSGKYQARIGYKGKQIHLGAFETKDEAELVYKQKRQELYGEFA